MTTPWQRSPNGYFRTVQAPFTPEMTAALEANPAFQAQFAVDPETQLATEQPEQVPKTFTVQQAIGFPMLKAFESKHHADLRGVDLDGRLDRLQQLIDEQSPELTELFELALGRVPSAAPVADATGTP